MKTYKPTNKNILTFLKQSNAIEGEHTQGALEDAMEAWHFIMSQDELTITNIKYTHALLLRFLSPQIAGFFRTADVVIGSNICPSYNMVNGLMLDWVETYGFAKTPKEIIKAHVEFEHIHPFQDGNGRVGRIIMNWQRLINNLPIVIIHEGKEQKDYYKLF